MIDDFSWTCWVVLWVIIVIILSNWAWSYILLVMFLWQTISGVSFSIAVGERAIRGMGAVHAGGNGAAIVGSLCTCSRWGDAQVWKISGSLAIASNSTSSGGVGKCSIAWVRVFVACTNLSNVVTVGTLKWCWKVSVSVIYLASVFFSWLPSNRNNGWVPSQCRMLVLHWVPMILSGWDWGGQEHGPPGVLRGWLQFWIHHVVCMQICWFQWLLSTVG